MFDRVLNTHTLDIDDNCNKKICSQKLFVLLAVLPKIYEELGRHRNIF